MNMTTNLIEQAIVEQARRVKERRSLRLKEAGDVVIWASNNFYAEATVDRPAGLIDLKPHQKAILRLAFQKTGRLYRFKTIIYSCIKKGGKTAIGGLVGRWASETWGDNGDVYFVGNDADQAKEKGFAALKTSIELHPDFNRSKQELPGRWLLRETGARYIPNGSRVHAVATDYKGEAGSNPIMTVWCVPIDMPILCADLTWIPAGSLSIGQKVVSFEEYPSKPNVSRKYLTGTIVDNGIRLLPSMEIKFIDDSQSLRATPEHRWLVRRRGQNLVFWKKTNEIDSSDELGQTVPVWDTDNTWDAGYVAGALDGEGYLSLNSKIRMPAAYNLGVVQLKGKYLLEKVAEIWESDGINYTHCQESNQTVARLRVDKKDSLMRTLGIYRPMRLLSKFTPDNLGHLRAYTWHRVKEVVPHEPEPMACISTDTKTYIAAGYMAHNTELWGFSDKAATRFWAEMAPAPTRPNSLRFIETYAGFVGESELLEELYNNAVTHGRQLRVKDLMEALGDKYEHNCFAEAPNPDSPVPCWVNESAGIFAYWDSGEIARRMPWQQGEHGQKYYAGEAATQTESQYRRLHLNEWVSAESEFIPIELWDACLNPLPLVPGEKTPLIVGLDAAVTGDCFGLVVVSRDPASPTDRIAIRLARKWAPPPGGKIDFDEPGKVLKWLRANFNVVQCPYDPHQLEYFVKKYRDELGLWFEGFDQGGRRLMSDKLLYDLIIHKRIRHDGDPDLRSHIQNCNAKIPKDEDDKLRLVKKSETRKIDLAVALSMAAAEALRLNI